jgi:dipeptidyl aminopeptidase/acylaminoacyl peptidase
VAFHATLKESVEGTDRLNAFDYVDGINAPLLALHGAADDVSPVALTYRMAERLESLGKPFELKVYGGAGHGFTLPDARQFQPDAAGDALDEAIAFLDRTLRR